MGEGAAPASEAPAESEPLTRIIRRAQGLAGINLEAKRAMVASRLGRRLRQLGMAMGDYADLVGSDRAEEAVLLDLVATTHTSWWREAAQFADLRRRVLAPMASSPSRPLRIWCAAASTGEEAWSIALCVHQAFRHLPRSHGAAILATDLSTRALARARAGRYDERAIASLPAAERAIALRADPDGGAGSWVVVDALRGLVHFAQLNLMDQWPMSGPFDAIFCRNVLLYFAPGTQATLVARLAGLLRPGGTLYVGLSEGLSALDHGLRRLGPSVYEKP